MFINNDLFGRRVEFIDQEDRDVYVVSTDGQVNMTLSYPKGTEVDKVYNAINGMGPAIPQLPQEDPIEE